MQIRFLLPFAWFTLLAACDSVNKTAGNDDAWGDEADWDESSEEPWDSPGSESDSDEEEWAEDWDADSDIDGDDGPMDGVSDGGDVDDTTDNIAEPEVDEGEGDEGAIRDTGTGDDVDSGSAFTDDDDSGVDDDGTDDTGVAGAAPIDSDGDGHSMADGDCNDDDATIHPDAAEVCNEVDDDCDGDIDEVEEGTIFTWYVDTDGDGFGVASTATIEGEDCFPPEGYSGTDGDCVDFDPMVYPGAVEQCDFIDNDCNGLIDEDDPDVILDTWYLDSDRDGYGDDATATEACFPPDDYIAVGGDIDDSDPSVRGDPLWMARIVIEMTWDTAGDDMDLHLLAPGGSLTDSETDCYYRTCKDTSFERIDWGVIGETFDDPTLNMDDISGTGPEVISLPEPAPGTYTVVVHDYGFSELEDGTEVSVRIFLDGELETSDTRVITGEGVYQAFAEIVVSEDSESPLVINTLDEIMVVDDGGSGTAGVEDGGSIFDTDGSGSDDGGTGTTDGADEGGDGAGDDESWDGDEAP